MASPLFVYGGLNMNEQEKFSRSIDFTLKWEGGRNFTVINGRPVVKGAAKNDSGGATAYGITSATLKAAYMAGIIHHDDICHLTLDEAKEIYRVKFWDKYNWGALDWPVCLCCFDCCVNHGGFASILQRAVNECGQSVIVDGKFGSKTFAALIACDPLMLAGAIYRQRKRYYEKIVANNPKQKVFLNGWLRRTNDMAETAGIML